MHWVRYETEGEVSYGIVEGDDVREVTGSPFDGYDVTETRRPLDSVRLLVPVVPGTFYAAGLNYVDHVREVATLLEEEDDEAAEEHFFFQMRRWTLTGYFTSEVGMTEAMDFVIWPGRYDGCVH